MGGSQGAQAINKAVVDALPYLIEFADQIQMFIKLGLLRLRRFKPNMNRYPCPIRGSYIACARFLILLRKSIALQMLWCVGQVG